MNGGIRFEYHIELVAGRHNGMRGLESAEPSQSRIFTCVAVVHCHVIVGALMMRLDLEFVEHLKC